VGVYGDIGRIVVGTAVLIGVGGVVTPARAHFVLVAPDSWMSQGEFGDPQKVGPCGEEGGGTPTSAVTAFRPGQTIEVTIDEKIFHPGHYRVALAVNDRSELPPEPAVTTVNGDPCGSTEIEDPPALPILADNMLPHTQPFEEPQTFTVTLPTDVTCTRCTLQIIEYMSHHGRPCFYHHCADLSIQGDPTPTPLPGDPTPTPTALPIDTPLVEPTMTSTVTASTSSATPTPPAMCAGDCDGNGTVTINEIVTLVSIALGQEPIGTCEAGNRDGDLQITVSEILSAVILELGSCSPSAAAAAAS
jgi:hypothetical protein